MVDYNDGKWHSFDDYDGGVHKKSLVEIVTSKGDVSKSQMEIADLEWFPVSTGKVSGFGKPVAFRVVIEHKEPREVFLAQKPHGGVWLEVLPRHEYAVKFREVIE